MRLTNNIAQLLLVSLVFTGISKTGSAEIELSNIELVGTITGKYTLAIIRIANQPDKIYQLEQKILDYSIKSITKNTVVISKQQKIITLKLGPIRKRQYSKIKSSTAQDDIARYEYRINRKTFKSLQYDTQSWLDDVALELETQNGFLSGYKITYVRQNSPAELLGLTAGDIIKGINNIFIKRKPEKFIQEMKLLTNVMEFTLNMRHNEKDFDITIIVDD